MIRVWTIRLDAACTARAAMLPDEEQARARAFKQRDDAMRFVGGRMVLRRLLGCALSTRDSDVPLSKGPHGKPFVSPGPQFNISHSGMWLCVAIAAVNVGIDVEWASDLGRFHDVAPRILTSAERALYEGLSEAARGDWLHRVWVRKEAQAKALGRGLSAFRELTVMPETDQQDLSVHDWRIDAQTRAALAFHPGAPEVVFHGPMMLDDFLAATPQVAA